MAGRGRGRGGAGRGLSFNIDTLGISRADGMPTTMFQPPPLFPPLQYKAVPLEASEEYNYLLALKQEFRGNSRESSHFVRAAAKKKDIGRYSDKYKLAQANDEFQPDWTRFPPELRPAKKRKVPKTDTSSSTTASRKRKLADTVSLDTIKDLEKADEQQGEEEEEVAAAEGTEEKKKDEDGEEEDNEEEEEYDEEDIEEENDYVTEYFDNGEDYGDDGDDNVDEGAIY